MFNSFPLFILAFISLVNSSDKIVNNFQTFSSLLKESFLLSPEATEIRPGVNLFNDFGVGYSLANIHSGGLWNISSQGIPSALRTVEKYIADDYGHLVGLLKKSKFKITSTIYSRHGNISVNNNAPSSLSTLMSHLIHVDYVNHPAQFVDSFSNVMEMGTKGHLDNELLPKGLWQKVFDNQTQGAFINTLYYKGKHLKPWMPVGQKLFNFDTFVNFLEVEGVFSFFQNDNITLVIVDIQQTPRKEIILCKSHVMMPTTELQKEVRHILQLNESFILKKLRVQIPALNVTNVYRHNLGLQMMGINETFCQVNASVPTRAIPDFVQQPMAQANHFEFSPKHIELSSATGSIVTLNTGDLDLDLEEEYDYDDLSSIIIKDDDSDEIGAVFRTSNHEPSLPPLPFILKRLKLEPPPFSVEQLKYPFPRFRSIREESDVDKKSERCWTQERIYENIMKGKLNKEMDYGESGNNATSSVIFDSPFLFILRDEVLGETFSGFVSSLCNYNKVVDAIHSSQIHSWLQDVFKVAFWKCY